MRAILVCVYLFLANASPHLFSRDFPNDYSLLIPDQDQEPFKRDPQPESISLKSGSDLILRCRSHGCHRSRHEWHFAPCRKCRNKNRLQWSKMQHTRRNCTSQMHVKNVTSSHSGLYKCEVNKFTTLYDVDVIELVKYEGEPPKLLEIFPSNSTIKPYSSVVVQCRVSSIHVPMILWFKQIENGLRYDLKYSEKYYIRINASHNVYPLPNDENVFVSKLNIHNVTYLDSGTYFCVAVTELGMDNQNFTIKVVSTLSYYEQPTSFSTLFLIPLPFVLIPVTVWLCYYKNKRAKKMKDSRNKEELILMQTTSQH
ncbi:PREDICTED: fibroblast growth factor receptor 4 [Nicrophorus vespilloides]|uniref:Fibroblast growth factor receptor 4 n=1 Tax=Nicrophorus vespilloides TaxID=110193 RepID=A0ABM1MG35_NICVS|nr:PREDICTED: fibroblast growth factor receptor 4 [Nicrophorus vespilloides]